MKSNSRLLLVLLVATAFAIPGESSAQSVCEGFSTVLNAMKRYRDRKNLEFYTLPGATCELSGGSFGCVWPRPRPHPSTGIVAFREWHGKILGEMKKLAGAFQQCIDQEQVPHEWDSFERHEESDYVMAYYIYTEGRPRMSVVLCIRLGDYRLPDDQDHTGARLSLAFHNDHNDSCGLL